jgi:hypothetical protein
MTRMISTSRFNGRSIADRPNDPTTR